MKRFSQLFILCTAMCSCGVYAGEGKLIGTSGITQIEGASGGGIVPWATIAGYGSKDEISASAFYSHVNLPDYQLHVYGANMGIYDRVELSVAQQKFDLSTLGGELKQDVYGLKVKLYGDVIYSSWPQVSAGAQYKQLKTSAIANALGAKSSDNNLDYYVNATKVHLGLVNGFNFVWNAGIRASRGNELGLLGYGSAKENDYQFLFEGSAAVLFSRHWAVGVEYREKPDNLGLNESDWRDVFVAYIPSKQFSIALAYAELGTIAGAKDQNGLFLNITGKLW